jgi:hypothetical protein
MRKLLTSDFMRGFGDELEKIAGLADFVAKNRGALGSAGAFLGHGAALGAGIGAVHGAVKNYEDMRERGAGVGTSIGAGALGGLGGAVSGGTRGALVGAAAGGALGHFRPEQAESLRKSLSSTSNPLGALGRFGQRQMHGLTGLKPAEGLSSDAIRGGSWASGRAASAEKATAKDHMLHGLQQEVEAKGLDNLPGIVNAMRGDDRVGALKTLAKHQWHNGDILTKATIAGSGLGLGAAALMPEAKDGPGKGESIGTAAGGMIGSLAGSALPMFPGQLAMSAGQGAGRRVGRTIDWLRGRRQPEHSPTELANHVTGEGQHTPAETNHGPGANGVNL